MKSKHKSGNPGWDKWEERKFVFNKILYDQDPETYSLEVKKYANGTNRIFRNGIYTVHVRYMDERGMNGAVHLSIRHNERKAIRDWRHFQRIKNEFVGTERTAVEVYPPESQLQDEANQYHLWVLPIGVTMPFGFKERFVRNPEEAKEWGGKQREFEDVPDAGTPLLETGASNE